MDLAQALGSALGIGLLAGIRLYATVFLLGILQRFGWIHLPAGLDALAHTWVLIASGSAGAIEFLADKIPWIDSVWDGVHTFIRPIGAALLGASAFADADPAFKAVIAVLCGGVAFTGHSSKAAARVVANHSPEPFSNAILSTVEDVMVPAGLYVALAHPLMALAVVGIFLLAFLWLARTIWRFFRRRVSVIAPAGSQATSTS